MPGITKHQRCSLDFNCYNQQGERISNLRSGTHESNPSFSTRNLLFDPRFRATGRKTEFFNFRREDGGWNINVSFHAFHRKRAILSAGYRSRFLRVNAKIFERIFPFFNLTVKGAMLIRFDDRMINKREEREQRVIRWNCHWVFFRVARDVFVNRKWRET